MKNTFILLLFTLLIKMNALTTTSISNGNWSNAAIWDNGVPCANCDVIINHSVTLNAIGQCSNIQINNNLTNMGFQITVKGNWTNNGIYSDLSGLVIFKGNGTQLITGSNRFYDVELNVKGNAIISTNNDSIFILNVLNLKSGVLDASNGYLVLVNDGTYDGRIGSVNSGNIIGSFTAEKWISRCDAQFSTYGSCMSSSLQSLDLYHTGFPGCPYYPTYNWPNTYYYNETVPGIMDSGYYTPSSLTSVNPRGQGFFYWFQNFSSPNDFPRKLLMKGSLDFQTTHDFNVSYTNNSTASNIGYNLIANPFPGTIDWGAGGGAWTKTKVNNAIYVWNTCSQVYASYVAGVGVNGGSRYIPEGQGFWVQTNNNNPKLKCSHKAIKNNSSQAILKTYAVLDSVNNVCFIKLGLDEIAVRIDSSATMFNDSLLDAGKIFSENSRLFSYLYSDSTIKYAINSVMDDYTTTKIVPIMVKGSGSLSFDKISTFINYSVYLKDLQTSVTYPLSDNYIYNYIQPSNLDSIYQPRFEIHFVNSGMTTNIKQKPVDPLFKIYPNPASNTVNIESDYKGKMKMYLFDLNGKIVIQKNTEFNKIETIDISRIKSGTYYLKLRNEMLNKTHKLIIVK